MIINKKITVERVSSTAAANSIIDVLRRQNGPLMFHQSGGCCDGSQPMCYEQNDFKIGERDVLLATVHGCPFYISHDQYEYWKHTHLTLDIVKGRGSSFSLEIPMGIRFIIHSRLFTEEELEALTH